MFNFLYENYYLLNIFVAFFIAVLMLRVNRLEYHLFLIFLYLSLHYAYGFLPFFKLDFVTNFVLMRSTSHREVNILFAVFLIISFAIILFKNKGILLTSNIHRRLLNWQCLSILATLLAWLIISIFHLFPLENSLAIKPFVIRLFSVVIILVIFLVVKSKTNLYGFNKDAFYKTAKAAFVLLVTMDLILVLQFYTGRTWVCCDLVRPDAFLFNPNNLGFWLMSVSAFFYFCYSKRIIFWMNHVAQLAVTVGLFLAAPRALFITTTILNFLFILAGFLKGKSELIYRLKGGLIFLPSMFLICFTVQFIEITPAQSPWKYRLLLSSERILITPLVVLDMINEKFKLIEHEKTLVQIYQKRIIGNKNSHRALMASGGSANILGRVVEESTDNAFLTAKRDDFWPSLSWFMVLIFSLLMAFKGGLIFRDSSVEALVIFLISSFISALSMNIFILIPSWVIFACAYGLLFSLVVDIQKEKPSNFKELK